MSVIDISRSPGRVFEHSSGKMGNSITTRRILTITLATGAAAAALIAASPASAAVGSWSLLTNAPPSACLPVALLTDGTVLCEGIASSSDVTWYILKPDVTGNYQNGTWATAHSSTYHYGNGPQFMLQDGRFWIGGDEFGGGPNHASVEIYDPVTDTWTTGRDYPYVDGNNQPVGIYDGAATFLADGRVFCSSYAGGPTPPGPSWARIAFLYDAVADTWSETFHGSPGPVTHEGGFTLLPDNRVFTISSVAASPAFLYTPSSDTWAQGASPSKPLTGSPSADDPGPQVVLYSGKVLVLGGYANGEPGTHSNIYDPVSDTWANNVPDMRAGGAGFHETAATVMPNGSVLTDIWSYSMGAIAFYEYDPVANTFTAAPAIPAGESDGWWPAELMLPNGQVLVYATPKSLLYTPSGSPNSSWKPIINSISLASGSTYTVTGRQLNGLTTGGAEGGDGDYTTSYPLIRISNGLSTYYARTFNFSTMAPAVAGTSQVTQFQFTAPPNLPRGALSVFVTASGVSSRPVKVTFNP